jgi:hypothetical protein
MRSRAAVGKTRTSRWISPSAFASPITFAEASLYPWKRLTAANASTSANSVITIAATATTIPLDSSVRQASVHLRRARNTPTATIGTPAIAMMRSAHSGTVLRMERMGFS